MKILSKIALLTLAGAFLFASCEKEQCTKTVPDLSFNRLELTGQDSVGEKVYSLYYDFKDCDGDIGLHENENITDEEGVIHEFNYYIDMFYMENGVWLKQEYPSGPGLNSRIPPLSDGGASTVLDGEIEYKLNYVSTGMYLHDTLKFEATLIDNAGHKSNVAESEAFVFN